MKKVLSISIAILGLTSCEKDITNPTPVETGFNRKDVCTVMHIFLDENNQIHFIGNGKHTINFPFGWSDIPSSAVTLKLKDSTATSYIYEITFRDDRTSATNTMFDPVGQFSVSTVGKTDVFSIGFTRNEDLGTHTRKTSCIIKYENNDFSCKVEQKTVKKNGPNEMGEQITKMFNFNSNFYTRYL